MRWILLYLCTGPMVAGFAQTDSAMPGLPLSNHSVHVELAGRGFLFGSLNYEYAITDRLSVGAGAGLVNAQVGQITRDNGGTPEDGRFFDLATTHMLYGNYFVGQKAHKMLFTAGGTLFFRYFRNRYPAEVVAGAQADLGWNSGLGYQYDGKRAFFRATAYLIALPEASEFLPQYLPWLGLAGGIRL